MTVDFQKQLQNHDERLTKIEKDVNDLKSDLKDGLKKIDDSNRLISNQNTEILKEVLKSNALKDEHKFEIERLKATNRFKMFGMIFGASGLAVVIFDLIFKALGK